ncbi:MAG: immunoglobulin domain-containing protein, partial [Lachnospiraceae bacterium]|nr:immunoglobulin domain-containing protein [Lachnospiraceae bacterium]
KHNGYQYYCAVKNPVGTVKSKTVTLTVVASKPTITTQPKAASVTAGKKATFKVVAEGTALSYQWYYRTSSTASWKKVTAAAGKKAAYSFTTAKKQNGYQYKCVVTNLKGSVTSKVVKLTVK